MERVDRLVLEIAAHATGAADAGDDDGVALVELHLVERHGQHHHDRADAAARAPDGREEVELETILVGHLRHRSLRHGYRLRPAPYIRSPKANPRDPAT